MKTEKNYAINLTLFKIIGFYQLIDPDAVKIYGYNIYKIINIMLVTITTVITVVGLSGYTYQIDNYSLDDVFKSMQTLFYIACITVGNVKMIIIICNAEKLLKLFNIAHESFFSNKYCRQKYFELVHHGHRLSTIFIWYFILFMSTGIMWMIVPIVILNNHHVDNNIQTQNNENIPKINVINLKYPISVNTYNKFYNTIYVIESVMTLYSAYGLVIFDIFLIAILQVISTYYEILSSAYEHIPFTYKRLKTENGKELISNDTIQKEFISINIESCNVYKHLKMFYKISRPVVYMYTVGDTTGMITMPYLIVMYYTKSGTIFNSDVLRFLYTLLTIGIQSYVYYSLYHLVNDKKQAVNFGMYSSEWTEWDISNKKQMLLAMRMNSSNNLKINLTPTKYIELPMLATIVRSSYSITSVLINSNIDKLKES